MSVGPAEILVILIVALLVFGPQRLPEVGRQVGAAVRELRRMQDTVRGELDMVLHPEHGTSSDDPEIEPGVTTRTVRRRRVATAPPDGSPRRISVVRPPNDTTSLRRRRSLPRAARLVHLIRTTELMRLGRCEDGRAVRRHDAVDGAPDRAPQAAADLVRGGRAVRDRRLHLLQPGPALPFRAVRHVPATAGLRSEGLQADRHRPAGAVPRAPEDRGLRRARAVGADRHVADLALHRARAAPERAALRRRLPRLGDRAVPPGLRRRLAHRHQGARVPARASAATRCGRSSTPTST